jgi:TonB family protein
MAPIVKETEAPVAAPTSSTPHIKASSESTARTQPVAMEIPVTVNGARTVDGSDKRVPFSESTQTVLVLPHGAVVRIATPLASGQLVFLTNEKTKKEVVCQVVKSKSTGSAAAYVELQFTEPAPGFWGLQVPGVAPAASPAHRPVAPLASAVSKPVAPTSLPAVKPPVAPKPATSAVPPVPPTKTVAPGVPPAPLHQAPAVVGSETVSHAQIVPEASKHSPIPAAPHAADPAKHIPSTDNEIKAPELAHVAPIASVPAAVTALQPATPAPPVRDYSKEISALFSPQVPVAPAPSSQPAPSSAAPTTDDLKLQAARLQAQLSSMLFTETPEGQKNASTPVEAKTEAPATDTIKKVGEVGQQNLKAVAPIDKSVVPAKKAAPIGLDEEVKVPSWLAPLSQNSQSISAEPADATVGSASQTVSANSEESFDALVAEAPRRSESAGFGGQLLSGEASTETSSSESKKGLLIGLAAAAVLVLGAGGWYYHQSHATPAVVSAARSTSVPEGTATSAPASTAASAPAISTPAVGDAHSAPIVPSNTSKRPAADRAGANATAPAGEHKNTNAEPVDAPVRTPAKPALGNVHLAAPVVNHRAQPQEVGDAMPSIDANAVPAGSDPFAAAGRHTPPTAPLPIGGDVKPAQLLKSVPPEYPEMAKAQHVSGKVEIDALVDVSGNVASVKVVSGPMLLRKAALDAVKQWKYRPARLDDQPTSMHLTVTVEFRGQ